MTSTHTPPHEGHSHRGHSPGHSQQGHSHEGHSHQDRPGHGPAPEHDTGLAELLDLDATLGAPVLAEALDAAFLALGSAPHRVLDLGAGTGTGTRALAARFPGARIDSLDASSAMLDRLGVAATAAGIADRVQPHLVDLDGNWPAVLSGPVDLAWAALSLHHVTDPAQLLDQVFGALRPGGVLVVIEMAGAPTYRPGDLGTGRGGLGARLVGALAAHGYPVTGEWTTALAAAGFAPVQRLELSFPASADTTDGARYLALELGRHLSRLTEDLAAEDLTALEAAIATLEGGTSELTVTSGRIVWIAVRPGDDQQGTGE